MEETTPDPPVVITTGPYVETVTDGVNETVAISGNLTTCGVPNCTYTWELACPDVPPLSIDGVDASLIVGPNGDVDTTGLPIGTNVTCNLTLTVTDGADQNGTGITTITVTCAHRCRCRLCAAPCMHCCVAMRRGRGGLHRNC